jgi:Protein RETICULATA-related
MLRRSSTCRRETDYVTTLFGKCTLALIFILLGFLVSAVEAYQPQGTTTTTKPNNNIFPWQRWTQQLHTGYQRRVAADPTFPSKSVTEILVAAGTQLTAEWNRRGVDRLLPELDFVVPAILTAVIGKYYR